MGNPCFAASPATIPQMESCEPMEMSICRHKITRDMPTASTNTEALLTRMLLNSLLE